LAAGCKLSQKGSPKYFLLKSCPTVKLSLKTLFY
jgi:hypothetical protein